MTPRSRKRLFFVGAVAIGAAGLALAFAARNVIRQRATARALESGMAAYARADYQAAMSDLGTYVGRVQSNPAAMLALADCRRHIPLENQKHLTTALAYAHVAARVVPSDPKPLEMMLDITEQLGYVTELRETAEGLLKLDPGNLNALNARTRALAALNDTAGALKSAQETAKLHPESILAYEGVIHFMQVLNQEPAAVKAVAKQAAADHPDSLQFALLECRTVMSTAQSADDRTAISELLKHAATLPIQSNEELSSLVRHLELLDLRDQIDQVLTRASSDPALAREASLTRIERSWKLGDTASAIQTLHALGPPNTTPSEREEAFRSIMGSADTLPIIAELNERHTKSAAYWSDVLRGRSDLDAGRIKEAFASLSRAIASDPTPGFAQFYMARSLERAGDWRAAIQQFAAASASDPIWRAPRFAFVSLLADHGQYAAARSAAANALASIRQWPEAALYATVSVAMLEAGKASAADASQILRELEDFRAAHPDDGTVGALYARALVAVGRPAEASAPARAVLGAAEPPQADNLFRLAAALRPTDAETADSLAILAEKTASSVGPGNKSLAARAESLIAAGRLREAKLLLEQAESTGGAPEQERIKLQLATLLDRLNDPNALQALVSLADTYPHSIPVQLAVLDSSCAWSDQETVSATLTRLAALIGEDATAWRICEARRLLTFEPAPSNAAKVVASLVPLAKSQPGNAQVALLVAEAYLKVDDTTSSGDIEHAIDILSKCADSDPTQPAVYPRLIELLQQAGRPAEASERLMAFRQIPALPASYRRLRARFLAAQGFRTEYSQELAELSAAGAPEDRLAYAVERADAGDTQTAARLFDALLAAPSPTPQLLAAAADFVDSRDGLDAALRVLDSLPANTRDGETKRLRSALLVKHQRFDEAEQLLRERTSNGGSQEWRDLASFFLERGRPNDAAEAAERGLAVDQTDPGLLWISGTVKLMLGKDTKTALSQLSAGAATPDRREIAEAFADAGGDVRKLDDALKAVTRRYPASQEAWRQLIRVRRQSGDLEGAAAAASSAAETAPGDAGILELATEVLAQAGRLDEASAVASSWRRVSPSNAMSADLVLARIAGIRGDYPTAVGILSPWAERLKKGTHATPENIEVYAAALLGAGKERDAISILGDRVRTDRTWMAIHFRIATTLSGRPDDLRRWLLGLELPESAAPEVLFAATQAWCCLAVGTALPSDLQEAGNLAERLVALPSYRGPGSAMLGAVRQAAGDPAGAVEAYRVAVAELPEDADAANNLAWALATASAERAATAVPIARHAVELAVQQRAPDMNRRRFLDTLGFALVRSGQYRAAVETYGQALELDPACPDLMIGIAEAHLGSGDAAQARRDIVQIDSLPAGANDLSPQLAARLQTLRHRLSGLQ